MGRSTEPAPRCRLARRPRGGREGLLGGGCRELTASGGGEKVFSETSTPPLQDIPCPSTSLPQTPPQRSFDLKPGRKTATPHVDSGGGAGKGDWIWKRGEGDQTPPPSGGGDHHLPRHPPQLSQSPFLLLLFRPAKLARIQQLRHLTPVAWQQWRPPLRVPPRLPQAQPRHCSGCNCASGRSSDSVLSALSFQPAQSGQLPRKGACSPSGSLSPCHHSSTPETLLSLLLFFITSGSGGLELLAGRPRLGAVQRGLPRPALSGSGGQSRNGLAPGLYSGPTGTWISKTSCTCLNQLEASRQTRLTSQRTPWPRAPSQALHSEWLRWQNKPVVGSKKPTKYQAF
ncbi:uncharacterized protein LOC111557449 [Felis catus]|uniref:uncharacterized protein LOC111557449 n=1 Tax=Felis catus TaxID=9685 RepID=UPI001D19B64B|nr:uncharacterized protein LOC111557449 [Felis catus]